VKTRYWILVICILPVFAHAQYSVVDSQRAPGDLVVGACGSPLPPDRSRRATNMRLVCGGTEVDFTRGPVKSPYWEDWSRLERGIGDDNLTVRREMQEVRLKEDPITWSGQAKYKTYETWNYSVRMRGANPLHCPTWVRTYDCKKTRSVPIMGTVCHDEPSHDEDEGSGSGMSGGGPGYWHGSGSGKSRSNSPDLGPRMNSPSRIVPRNGGSSGGSGGKGGDHSSSGSRRRSFLNEFIVGPAMAEQVCSPGVVGYRDEEYWDKCHEDMVDVCEWEEQQTGIRFCSDETIDYTLSFAKPDSKWAPGQAGYHDLLPNKYDLLPGEWEKISLLTNNGLSDDIGGVGRSDTIRPSIEFENQWNEYSVHFDRDTFRCQKNTPISINAQISTDRRRVRKAPNALAVATDVYGRANGLKADEYYLPDGEKARLRPHRILLEDSSNQVMLIAARQSRKFGNMDPESVSAVHDTKLKPISAQEMGFWKNTLLRVSFVEKSSCFGEHTKIFADVLDTTSALTKSEGNQLIIPLDGTSGNIDSFYHPYGIIGKVISLFGGPVDLELTPGAMYEFRVSMQQQGLPFYENGCKNNALTCNGKDVNPAMYSEDLVIEFQADPRVDRRSWLQKFENFHRKKLWNKFRGCGGPQ
jgi:hypothetical protein